MLGYPDEDTMLVKKIGRTRKQSVEEIQALNENESNHHAKESGGDIVTSSVMQRGNTSLRIELLQQHPRRTPLRVQSAEERRSKS
jgi:hypothetical protein